MKIGDEVVYTDDPMLYGKGRIKQVLADGRLRVTFHDGNGQVFTDSFQPHELELLSVWVEAPDLDFAA